MIEYCDWCKKIVDNTHLFINGSDYEIFDSVCDTCHMEMVKLRRSITAKVPDDIRKNSRVMYTGPDYDKWCKEYEEGIEKDKQEYIDL